jgi:hypothetical protein
MDLSNLSASVTLFAYADDIAVVLSYELIPTLIEDAKSTHKNIMGYFLNRRLEINLSKSGSMLVSLLRPPVINWPEEGLLPPRVLKYKYLGCLIDSKLKLKDWCESLIASTRTRVVLIKRLSTTKRLSRRQLEVLYTAIVRGRLMYACSIWARSPYSERVINAEISGQRVTFGALLGTSHARILDESNLTPFTDLIVRADLRLYLAIRTRQALDMLNTTLTDFLHPLNDEKEHTTLYSIGMQPYLYGFLNDSFSPADILQKLPSKPKRRSRRSFSNETYLARFRMSRIPTRWWAASIGLCDTPLCRHCESTIEDDDHIFFNCPSLNYSMFVPYNFTNLSALSEYLRTMENTFDLENAVLRFIFFNNLFSVQNAQLNDEQPPPLPSSIPKRKREPSSSPVRERKRTKSTHLGKRNAELNIELNQSPKRRFLCPAKFIAVMRENKN